jgi:Tfp pilus assembly protein PilO
MSRRVRMILMALGLVVVAVLVWFFLLSPLRGDIKTTDASITDLQDKLTSAKLTLRQAETTKAEGRLNQARLLELAKMIPSSDELPSLLLQIQDLADQSGIDFISITPGEASEVEGASFQILPLDLTFTGTYFDLSDFVWRAEQMVAGPGRLLAIKSINLALSNAGAATAGAVSPGLDVNLSLLAFLIPPGGTAASSGGGSSTSEKPAAGGGTSTSTTEASKQ